MPRVRNIGASDLNEAGVVIRAGRFGVLPAGASLDALVAAGRVALAPEVKGHVGPTESLGTLALGPAALVTVKPPAPSGEGSPGEWAVLPGASWTTQTTDPCLVLPEVVIAASLEIVSAVEADPAAASAAVLITAASEDGATSTDARATSEQPWTFVDGGGDGAGFLIARDKQPGEPWFSLGGPVTVAIAVRWEVAPADPDAYIACPAVVAALTVIPFAAD